MSANAKCGVSLINIAVLLIAMTATGMSAVKVQKQSKEAEAYILAGEYAKEERWQDLVEHCKRYLRDKPSDAEMISILGVAYSELGKHEESLDAFKRVVQLRPPNQGDRFNLGVAHSKAGREQEAVEIYQKLIKDYPDMALTYINLGG
jgi:tetratricopeptide (TPR) repeat protein